MSILHRTRKIAPTRRTARADAPFAEGVFPDPAGLSDEERRILDELNGDYPAGAVESDPADWPAGLAEQRFVPSAEDEAWWAAESNRLARDYVVRRGTVASSMIDPTLAVALANGTIVLY